MQKTDITAHVIVKHEPFIYYAVKSVYDYCDSILLYDTGSTDHTLEDIQQLIKEDVDKKIIFKQIQLGFDEEKWSLSGLQTFIDTNAGKMSVGKCRQMQLDETKTKFALLVDGDEIYHRSAIKKIATELVPNFPKDKLAVGFPLTWFYDLKHTFTAHTFPYNGRLLVNDALYMSADSPNEQHLIKGSGDFFTYEHPNYLIYDCITPYAHFETVFRPWRRKAMVPANNVKPFTGTFPEVMIENPTYLERYKRENA
jgi:glycosyltransferase involved in cell wall biosynthesis